MTKRNLTEQRPVRYTHRVLLATLGQRGRVAMKFIRSEFMPAVSSSRPPTQRSPRLNSHRGAVRLEVDDLPANWRDDDFEISVMTLVGRRLRRLQYPRFGLLLGSVVRQLGHSADLAISSGLALLAVAAQYILRRMRQLDGSGPEWMRHQIGRLRARLERLLGYCFLGLAVVLFPLTYVGYQAGTILR